MLAWFGWKPSSHCRSAAGYRVDGRVLRAYFSRTMDSIRATQRAVRIGNVCHAIHHAGGRSPDELSGHPRRRVLAPHGWLFPVSRGQLEERSAVFHSVLQSVRLEEVMLTDFAAVSPPADTLEDALDKAVHTLQDDFPVVRDNLVGAISKQNLDASCLTAMDMCSPR